MVYTVDDERKYIEHLKQRISELKKERKAVIVVHNYQREEVQDIADYIGDSLELARSVINVDAEVIVFCGVHFMAESAVILNPEKKVLLPVKEAGCPMADMITAEKLKLIKQQHPDAAVVCYVNSSARVKAESDICCTSSNAIEVVRALPHKKIIFVPDKNLGAYIQDNVKEKEIILWNGFCPTHIRLTEEEVIEAKKNYPQAQFIAHPECCPEVLALADEVLSTGGMFKYVKNSSAKDFIIGTERGVVCRLKKENPDKNFYLPSEHLVCANMKLITLGWVAHSLEFMVHEVNVPEEIRMKAKLALERMLEVSKKVRVGK
ncbi:MAG: quinolinate synthase NadA [Candidatus Omnitrophica bacterium]|nr:quinolinate synthase NadA [Candidatus Omnitrophota bacterium]